MYQHDAQRTGRTAAVVPNEPSRVWSLVLGAGGSDNNSPTIGPDGTIYVSSGSADYLAVSPDGSLRWRARYSTPRGPAAIRADGDLFVPRHDKFSKLDDATGAILCEHSSSARGAPALDSDGYSYYFDAHVGTEQLRKIDPFCEDVWAYPMPGGVRSHVALGHDGSVYAATDFALVKLNGRTGALAWSLPIASSVGAPTIGDDGTIYITVESSRALWARNPDSSERWSHTFNDPLFKVDVPDTGSAALGADGTIYVPGLWGYPLRPALVALNPDGTEKWMYVDQALSYRIPSPVVDGAGRIFLGAGGRIVALSPVDGTLLWSVEAGGIVGQHAPAIGDGGALYAVTDDGVLVTFDQGCPENVITDPPFNFRQVAAHGDPLAGQTITGFQDVEIKRDGLVTFRATLGGAPGHAVKEELPGGGFEVLTPGMTLGGYTLSAVELPRRDANGNEYLMATTTQLGCVVFLNRTLFLQAGAGPAPVQVAELESGYLDFNDVGTLLVRGKLAGDTWMSVLAVNTTTHAVTRLARQYYSIGGFELANISSAPRHGLSNTGILVIQATHTGQFAILTQSQVIVRSGDVVDGHRIGSLFQPYTTVDGTIFYRGTGADSSDIYRYVPGGDHSFVRGLGHTIAGQPLLDIEGYTIDDSGRLAYVALLLGTREGLFVDETPVAVASVTNINGATVQGVGIVSLNNAGQVAFAASLEGGTTGLFAATPVIPLDGNGDAQIDIDDYALFAACLTGPGEWVTPECTVFDVDDNCVVDLADWAIFQAAYEGADCNSNGRADILDVVLYGFADCNGNLVPDECDLASGVSTDFNLNGRPDECDPDCNDNGIPDDFELAQGTSPDCNSNAVPDQCDLADGTEPDCNSNGVPDSCDLVGGTSPDCTDNGVPDECEADCNSNGTADTCEIAAGSAADCNANLTPDECELASGSATDCNENAIPDECDADCNSDGLPDDCEPWMDCNLNGITDICDIARATSTDLNSNAVPDECEGDCNSNGVPDGAELLQHDCNHNGLLDECDGTQDCNGNGIHDACELRGYRRAYALFGETTGDLFGYAIGAVGDVNQDGCGDLVVGAIYRGQPLGADGSSYLYALDPDHATLLARVDGTDRFGWRVAALGDVNGDGKPDYAVGSPFDDTYGDNAGVVAVVSGADRTIGGVCTAHPGVISLVTRPGPYVGYSLGGLAQQHQLLLATRNGAGHAYVIDGATGVTRAHLIGGGAPFARISDEGDITAVGDVLGDDGVCDFAVTEDGNLGSQGTVYLLDGTITTATPLLISTVAGRTLHGMYAEDRIGHNRNGRTIAELPDITGDNQADILVGAYHAAASTGAVLVFDGATGTVVYRADGSLEQEAFGSAVAALGDIDSDGRGDFAVSAPHDLGGPGPAGYVYVLSGGAASRLQILTDGQTGFGAAVEALGDLNADGVTDFAVASYYALDGRGAVYIYLSTSRDLNSNGIPDECDPGQQP